MHLVQVLLPLYDNQGERIAPDAFGQLEALLLARFGGLTTYARAPARGLWDPGEGEASNAKPMVDDLVIVEVMVQELDTAWWHTLRASLESQFRQ
ncbi:MAG: hypothetical protein JWP36_2249, partial [Paucimonas sp.]|nr:hypothetical protein [Paucimonas sp.]